MAASSTAADDHHHVLVNVLDDVDDGLDGSNEEVTVGEVMTSLNDRGFGGLCAVIGILAATPVIGALPGVSIGAAVLVLLVAGQQVVGRNSLWVPGWLARQSFDRETFQQSIEKVRPYAKWVDKLISPRLSWIIGGNTERRVAAVAMCILALTMVPLALVPWGVFPPALAIAALGIAITGRDGVFAIAGYVLCAITVYVLYAFSGVIASIL